METLIKNSVQKNGKNREALIPVLRDVVKEKRFVSEEAMKIIARELGLSAAQVYGTASFYSFLETKELGENVIRLCKTIVCDTKGKQEIVSAIEKKLGIKMGQTTADKKFSLLETNCLGQCENGPAMLINDCIYTKLTPVTAIEAIDKHFSK